MNQRFDLKLIHLLLLFFVICSQFLVTELRAHKAPDNLPIDLKFKKIHTSGVYLEKTGTRDIHLYFLFNRDLQSLKESQTLPIRYYSDTKLRTKKYKHMRIRTFQMENIPLYFYSPPDENGYFGDRWWDFKGIKDGDYSFEVVSKNSSPVIAVTKNWHGYDNWGGIWTKVFNLKGEFLNKYATGGNPIISPSGRFIFTRSGGTMGQKTYLIDRKDQAVREYKYLFYSSINFNDNQIVLKSDDGETQAVFNDEGQLVKKMF